MTTFKPKFAKPSDNSSFLDKNDATFQETTSFVYNRYVSQTIDTQRKRLPIYENRNHILYLMEKYQTLILVGETGCGKSTQIPQYLMEANWPLQIGICEPRRVAAISLANRVADETGSLVQSETVGYAVRFDACFNKPKIKFMTEGILIRELMQDPMLGNYSVIMLDEVHERSLYTDILMGLFKKILRKRSDLKLIVASATLEAENLKNYFNFNVNKDTSYILSVQNRQYPVDIYYTVEPVPCYVAASVDTAVRINSSKNQGDILIFLTGVEEVEKATKLLRQHADIIEESNKNNKFVVYPMHGSLPYHDQLKVFKPPPENHRKIVVSTNLAETSITIPGIVHVIDCGFVKLRWFNIETHTDSLMLLPVSKASCTQRAGRAGRLRAGKVYRLFTEDFYEKLPETTAPEIVRSDLTQVILQLKALGIKNVLNFKFLDPPPLENLRSALEILYALNALDIQGELTKPLGYNMAEFALSPFYAKVLLNSGEFSCSEEILTIISVLQVETIFTKPTTGNSTAKARIQKRHFEVAEGDLITYLNVYNAFVQSEMSREFCHKNFISYKSMKRVVEIRKRLEKTLKNYNVSIISASGCTDLILKCLVSGLFPNAAYLHPSGVYKTVRGDVELYVNPNSVLYTIKQPQWVVFCEVVHTKKLYMKDISVIKDEWLLELAPHFYYRTSYRDSVF